MEVVGFWCSRGVGGVLCTIVGKKGMDGGEGMSGGVVFVVGEMFWCCGRRGLGFWMDGLVVVR